MSGSAQGDERLALIETTREWGYFLGNTVKLAERFRGKRVLDVGMGGGPHAIPYIELGAAAYIGVDPIVGSDRVRDHRSLKDPSFPGYHQFPYSKADIERIYPNVKLFPTVLENVAREVRALKPEFAVMTSVTEHLEHPDSVVAAIWEVLAKDGIFWAAHHSYYSWSGHHAYPRGVTSWDRSNPKHNAFVDWKHLEPSHPFHSDPTLNRIRLEDMRLVVAKYFELQEWDSIIDSQAVARLTPEIRDRWKKYSLAELLTRTVRIVGKRRDVPLDIDFKDRQLFHPDEKYLAHRSYADEDIAPYRLAENKVYFYQGEYIASHSINDYAARRIFDTLKHGDQLSLLKEGERHRFTVDKVMRPEGTSPIVRLVEPVPEALRGVNYSNWTIEL